MIQIRPVWNFLHKKKNIRLDVKVEIRDSKGKVIRVIEEECHSFVMGIIDMLGSIFYQVSVASCCSRYKYSKRYWWFK